MSENIYEKKRHVEDIVQILEKGLENLSSEDIRKLKAELPLAISELPDLTRTGVEKKETYGSSKDDNGGC